MHSYINATNTSMHVLCPFSTSKHLMERMRELKFAFRWTLSSWQRMFRAPLLTAVGFVEEAIPGINFLPTATLGKTIPHLAIPPTHPADKHCCKFHLWQKRECHTLRQWIAWGRLMAYIIFSGNWFSCNCIRGWSWREKRKKKIEKKLTSHFFEASRRERLRVCLEARQHWHLRGCILSCVQGG